MGKSEQPAFHLTPLQVGETPESLKLSESSFGGALLCWWGWCKQHPVGSGHLCGRPEGSRFREARGSER
jgi:hypothetical protein